MLRAAFFKVSTLALIIPGIDSGISFKISKTFLGRLQVTMPIIRSIIMNDFYLIWKKISMFLNRETNLIL